LKGLLPPLHHFVPCCIAVVDINKTLFYKKCLFKN